MTNRFSASFKYLHDLQVLTLILFTFAGTCWWENGIKEAQRVKIRHWYNFVDIVNIWICQLYGYWQYWKSLKYWHSKEGVHYKRFLLRPSSDKNIHSNFIPDCALAANITLMITIQQVYLHWKVELTLVSLEQINQVTKANNWSMLFVNNSKWINIWEDNVWWIIGTSISNKLKFWYMKLQIHLNPAGYFGKPFSMQQQVVSIKSRAAFQNEKNGNLVQKFCLHAKQGVKNMAFLICGTMIWIPLDIETSDNGGRLCYHVKIQIPERLVERVDILAFDALLVR